MFSIIMQMARRTMQGKKNLLLIFCAYFITLCGSLSAEIISTNNDWEYKFSGVYKPESFFGRNTNWLNNSNDFDKVYYSRHSLDLMVDILYGSKTYGTKIAELLFQVRNKGVWGNPESIANTTEADIKILETVVGPHRHGFPRMVFWI